MFDDIWDWLIKESNGERELTGEELIEYLMRRFGLSREDAENVEMFHAMPQGGPLGMADSMEDWQAMLERGDPIDIGFRLLKAFEEYYQE